jgi:hypothetical protein
MAGDFLKQLTERFQPSASAFKALAATGVRSWDDLASLVQSFPSVAQAYGLPTIDEMFPAAADLFESLVQDAQALPFPFHTGALPPEDAEDLEITAGFPAPPSKESRAAASGFLDLGPAYWPVRHQGDRETCVAFAAVACVEHAEGFDADLSEQFLYWVMKTKTAGSPKNYDGARLLQARDALGIFGLCEEAQVGYVKTAVNPVYGAEPPQAVRIAAKTRIRKTIYENRPKKASSVLIGLLKKNRPVAVSLPVFRDSAAGSKTTNWNTPVARDWGRVLNPPPGSKSNVGHCVCVTGFIADAQEPAGGYFIFRNSWGEAWGAKSPSKYSRAPAPGYGEISATYVEEYCWELLQV